MIHVKYFGMIAEATNCSEEKIALENQKLADLLQKLTIKYKLDELPLNVAVNKNMVDKNSDYTINENDEIAILPPFAGG
ncbi:MoaD/ThiS family protein [Leeuwenhoekiella sp. A16]|uniref:MoaD/ThiS family protein n=1 Tax=unclassified Leeuwenhoekiella TaxID=2615029 RepID=UPI003A7F908B